MNSNKLPNCSEILYLEADVNYTIFHLIDGKKIISSFTLKTFEAKEKLTSFLRINKSFLLNPAFIIDVEKEKNTCLIKITNGEYFRSSRRKSYLFK